MAKTDGTTAANRNRRIRQEALRDQLSNQKHVEHVVDCIDKLENLDLELDQLSVTRLKGAIDSRLKLVNKYLSDLKSVELTGDDENPVEVNVTHGMSTDAAKLLEKIRGTSATS